MTIKKRKMLWKIWKSERSVSMVRKSVAVGGLNPSSNFRYLLSTQQQQVVDSVEVPPASFISQIPGRLFRAAKWMRTPAYRSVNKGSRRKTETCRARPDFRVETSPMAPKRPAQASTRETFEFPQEISLTKQSQSKKYCNFRERYLARDKRKWSDRL